MDISSIEARCVRAENQGSVMCRQPPLVNGIKRWIAWICNEMRIRHGINELMALDDGVLSDMGLNRGNIEHAARYGRLPVRTNGGVGGCSRKPQGASRDH